MWGAIGIKDCYSSLCWLCLASDSDKNMTDKACISICCLYNRSSGSILSTQPLNSMIFQKVTVRFSRLCCRIISSFLQNPVLRAAHPQMADSFLSWEIMAFDPSVSLFFSCLISLLVAVPFISSWTGFWSHSNAQYASANFNGKTLVPSGVIVTQAIGNM